jgi:protein-S-isoprenylcysteine O-methyltransferase Ste14
MRRLLGIVFGIGTQSLFAFTVWHLVWFLKGGIPAASARGNLVFDAGLAAQFAVPHSMLLLPAVRERLTRVIPSAFYGCFYCVVTCGCLLLMFGLWQPSAHVVWQFNGAARRAVQVAFVGSWVGLFYSLHLTGLGYQTGLTPWWHWLRGRPLPPRRFQPRGAYLWLRHPVYLSFLGLVWFTPDVTLDRAVLIGTWSFYIAIGSCLKDRRLAYYLGNRYREYQARVSGYPGIWFGPLGRSPTIERPPHRAEPFEEKTLSPPGRRAA